MKQRNEYYRTLSNELAACIDTGNQGQAEHCIALAESYLDDGKISVQHRADIQADFDQAFPDA